MQLEDSLNDRNLFLEEGEWLREQVESLRQERLLQLQQQQAVEAELSYTRQELARAHQELLLMNQELQQRVADQIAPVVAPVVAKLLPPPQKFTETISHFYGQPIPLEGQDAAQALTYDRIDLPANRTGQFDRLLLLTTQTSVQDGDCYQFAAQLVIVKAEFIKIKTKSTKLHRMSQQSRQSAAEIRQQTHQNIQQTKGIEQSKQLLKQTKAAEPQKFVVPQPVGQEPPSNQPIDALIEQLAEALDSRTDRQDQQIAQQSEWDARQQPQVEQQLQRTQELQHRVDVKAAAKGRAAGGRAVRSGR